MIKMLMRLVFLAIVVGFIFIGLAIYSGGERFRWLGKRAAEQGEKVGEKADKIKQVSDKIIKGIGQTAEKVKEFTGSKESKKDEKPH